MRRTPMSRGKAMSRGTTPLDRGKPMDRGQPMARTAAKRTRSVVKRKRYDPDAEPDLFEQSKPVVHKRSGGRCERCRRADASDVHHRRPRQMGGDKGPVTNGPANLVHLCRPCHVWCEDYRTDAEDTGWLVRRGVTTPGDVVLVPLRGRPFRLDDVGEYLAAA